MMFLSAEEKPQLKIVESGVGPFMEGEIVGVKHMNGFACILHCLGSVVLL